MHAQSLENGQPSLTLSSASFGAALRPAGSYVFGSGVEKTFEVLAFLEHAILLADAGLFLTYLVVTAIKSVKEMWK